MGDFRRLEVRQDSSVSGNNLRCPKKAARQPFHEDILLRDTIPDSVALSPLEDGTVSLHLNIYFEGYYPVPRASLANRGHNNTARPENIQTRV